MTAEEIRHEGLHTNRLSINPREAAFAGVWAEYNKKVRGVNGGNSRLEILLTPDYDSSTCGYATPVTQHDATVVATVIQWLGSSIGSDFLRAVEERMRKAG